MVEELKTIPSKSSQTTSPVLGHIEIIPNETSAELAVFFSSIRHMNGGGLYFSRSSTESSSSTYLEKARAMQGPDYMWLTLLQCINL